MKKRYKILLWLLLSFFLLVMAVIILVTQTKFLEKQINLALKAFLEKEYPMRITIADISGNVISGLKLSGLKVEYTEKGFEYQMLSLDSLIVDYSVSDLWNKRWILKRVVLAQPKAELRQTKEGRWLVPKFKPAKGLRKSGLFDFQIEDLGLYNGEIVLSTRSDSLFFDSINAGLKLVKDRKGWQIQVPAGSLRSLQDSLEIISVQTGLTLKEKRIDLDALLLKTNWGNFEVAGTVELGSKPSFDVAVNSEQVILEDLSKLLPNIKLEGRVDVNSKLSGYLKDFSGESIVNGIFFGRDFRNVKTSWAFKGNQLQFKRIRGKIFLADLEGSAKLNLKSHPPSYELSCRVDSLDIANIIQGELHSNFSGLVNLTGQGFSDREMKLSLDVQLGSGELDIYDFDSAWGAMDIDLNQIYFHPGFAARYKHTSGSFSGSLEYEGKIDLTGQVTFDNLTDFWGKTFLKEIGGRGQADIRVSGLTQDFDLSGLFWSDSAWVYRLYSSDLKAQFDIKTFITNQQGKVELDFRKGKAWDIPYDSLLGKITVDSLFVTVDSAFGGNQYAFLQFKADLDAAQKIQPLRIYDGSIIFQGIPFSTGKDTLLVEVRENDYLFKEARLQNGKGSLFLSGIITYDQEMDLQLEFENLNIRPWLELYLPQREMYGIFSASSQIKGNFSDPQMKLQGRIDSLKFLEVSLGELSGVLSYQDSTLQVDSLVLASPEWHYLCTGRIPVNLSFTDTASQRLLDLPQKIDFQGEGNKFSVVHLFLPDIEYLKGEFHTQIEISGTPLHPQLNGNISVVAGEVKIDQLKDPLTKLVMEIRMENDKIYFDKLEAQLEGKALVKQGKPIQKYIRDFLTLRFLSSTKPPQGRLAVRGTMQVLELDRFLYDLSITGRNFPFVYEYMEVGGITDFDLKVEGETPPKVSGNFALKQLEYEEPFGSPVTLALAGQKVADPSALWDWEIILAAPNNIWVRNTDMNAEFSGEVAVYRIDGQLVWLGILDALRGRFYVAGRAFDIETGHIIFQNIEQPDPTLDFLISTRIYESPEASGYAAGSGEKVELKVAGTVSQPEIGTPEGSTYSEEQVLEMVVLQTQSDTTNANASPFQEKVATSLGAGMGSQIVEKFAYGLGVETFYLRPSKGAGFDFSQSEITVGWYLTRGLYWQYSSKFSTTPDLALQYRLNRNLFLEGTRDRENLYHLGLNLRWEF